MEQDNEGFTGEMQSQGRGIALTAGTDQKSDLKLRGTQSGNEKIIECWIWKKSLVARRISLSIVQQRFKGLFKDIKNLSVSNLLLDPDLYLYKKVSHVSKYCLNE